MKQKRMSVRFNLDVEEERRAWKHLHESNSSMRKTVIAALNAFFEPVNPAVKNVLREVVLECLQEVSLERVPQTEHATAVSEDEAALLDSLDDLLDG